MLFLTKKGRAPSCSGHLRKEGTFVQKATRPSSSIDSSAVLVVAIIGPSSDGSWIRGFPAPDCSGCGFVIPLETLQRGEGEWKWDASLGGLKPQEEKTAPSTFSATPHPRWSVTARDQAGCPGSPDPERLPIPADPGQWLFGSGCSFRTHSESGSQLRGSCGVSPHSPSLSHDACMLVNRYTPGFRGMLGVHCAMLGWGCASGDRAAGAMGRSRSRGVSRQDKRGAT